MLVVPARLDAAPRYNIVTLGLTDSEHTRGDGYQQSDAQFLNEAGQVVGNSYRYNGSTSLGATPWLYDGSTLRNLGLTDSEHTRSDGYQSSYAQALNESGQVIGHSGRYSGNASLGLTAWLYGGSTTQNIGLTDGEHTRSDGYQYNYVLYLNEASQVVGYSNRYNGSTSLGTTAWLYDGSTTKNIGLTGTEHTKSNGYQSSSPTALNEAGQVVGNSSRYNGGSTELGQSAWRYNGSTTQNIGLTNSEHTSSSGYRYNYAQYLNEAGQVVGYASRYNGGSTSLGQSVWLYDGSTTKNIGLTNSEHTSSSGYRYSYAAGLNEAGQAIGYAYRYGGGSTSLGQSVWLYDGSTTKNIGLTGTEHTRSDGYQYSSPTALNQAGQVIGFSYRYKGGNTFLGDTAWLYDGSTTKNLGLTDAMHTSSSGSQDSFATALNEAGQVIGYSLRYNGGSASLGQSGWFYDDDLDQTFALVFSLRSDGYASTQPRFLSDTGVVLGYYNLYEAGVYVNQSLFYWSLAEGFHDLSELIVGLDTSDWGQLYSMARTNQAGNLIGNSRRTDQTNGQLVYLLVPQADQPVVPEPSTLVLLSSGLILVSLLRWRSARRFIEDTTPSIEACIANARCTAAD